MKRKRRIKCKIPGCSSSLGHRKSTLVERQAPEAMATAVTATCVMAEVTAPWTFPAAAAAAITLAWSKRQLNFGRLRRNLQKNIGNGEFFGAKPSIVDFDSLDLNHLNLGMLFTYC